MTKHLLRKLLVGGGTLVLLCGVLSSCQLNDQSTAMTQAMTSQTGEIQIAATGKPYNNRYIGLFRLRDGKIVLFKEYFNPTILTESFGSGLGENFNTK